MPRNARIDTPGALHHIIVRGIERNAIFNDSTDYRNFTDRMGRVLVETGTPCFAWALMTNHAHLLLRTGRVPMATIMRRLLTGYAQQYNRRHSRHGHLFQNRYKSFLCEEDPYLLELVRYIHLNPVRAGMVSDVKQLGTCLKTGHAALMGRVANDWQDIDYVLGRFGKTRRTARDAYASFVAKGIAQGRRPELTGGGLIRSHGGWSAVKALRTTGMRLMGDERILGSSDFVEAVLRQANEDLDNHSRLQARGLDLATLIDWVCDELGLDRYLLYSASRQRPVARARSIICALALDTLQISGATVAWQLSLSPSAVSKAASRGRRDDQTRRLAELLLNG